MRSIVTTYDRLAAEAPQDLGAYLYLYGVDHDMVTAYRNAIRDAEARARRPRRNPGNCQRIVRITVRHAR
ncbi:hypothetical protein ACIRS1_10940 [Kitasatospora sp. NPDC101176]|uniref:hypothetical protein n=1 Tax=Kitasatospora sp. NPDC101176 TaxID=3364099 RepID=UPI003800B6B2